jgi:MYXO-CTERM domain-containing protein
MDRSRITLGAVATAAITGFVSSCGPTAPGEQVGVATSAYTFPNDQTAFDFFRGKGLTAAQAAGVVGNLDQESGVDPTAIQYGGGPGRGIAQWSTGGRWDSDTSDNATWYAAQQGEDVWSLTLQLEFVWYELTTFSSYGLAALQAATDVTAATVAFEDDFEMCGSCDESARVTYAQTVLAAFGSDPVDAGPPLDASTADGAVGTSCVVTTTGEQGVCMDTAACAALSGHTSTPGYCPGAASIECCTSTGDAGSSHHDAAAPHHDAGERDAVAPEPDAGEHDAATRAGADSGPDASPSRIADAGRDATGVQNSTTGGGSGGCSAAPEGTDGRTGWFAFVAFGLAVAAPRRARARRSSDCAR